MAISSSRRTLVLDADRYPIAGVFKISRGAKTEAHTVRATIQEGAFTGRGECTPYARYGESVESVLAQAQSIRSDLEAGCGRSDLQKLLPAGAARNALDCALWDLEAKKSGRRAYRAAGWESLTPVTTAYTISVGEPDSMAVEAAKAAHRPLLKIKLGGAGDPERIAAVRQAAPRSELIVDANEAWREQTLEENFAACVKAEVALIEQPLPAGEDDALTRIRRTIPVCADESAHDRDGLAQLVGRYDAINVKLDKTGGLTEALEVVKAARQLGLEIFVGCMVGSSLATAPAFLLTPAARYVDLDGPLLLARDCEPSLQYRGSLLYPPEPELWG